ncbi:MAG: copper chaperone PCu(A)C [Acidocella sp.]|nr:copper chaperone PCu(A)C [Acidocella sp.]
MSTLLKTLLTTAFAALPLAASAGAPPGLSVQSPWMRYLLPTVPAAGYFTLVNNSDTPLALAGAASPACYLTTLHDSSEASGTSMMTTVPSVTIPAHGSLSFAPGGYHIMCMQPVMKVGDKVNVTLSFADGLSLAVIMPVYGAGGPP